MAADPQPGSSSSSLCLAPDETTALANVRRWARANFRASDDLELLLTEIVANATQHGARAPITVEISRDAESLTVVVTNERRPGTSVPDPSCRPVDVTSQRGRGLQIAKTVSDQLTVEQSGTTVTVSAVISTPTMLIRRPFR